MRSRQFRRQALAASSNSTASRSNSRLAALTSPANCSATNVVEALAALAEEVPGTAVAWAFRRPLAAANFGGGRDDGLAARGALGARARALVEEGRVRAFAPFLVRRFSDAPNGAVRVEGLLDGRPHAVEADRVVGTTGFRPDLAPLAELRLSLDPAVQATPALVPLIDPNLHSCGTVRPHGEAELRHPAEPGFYIAGMKAYGRAPTFLMATGHEQVRSIAAHLAGDVEAARRVELVLPETGVCSGAKPKVAVEAAAGAATTRSYCGGTTAMPGKATSAVPASGSTRASSVPAARTSRSSIRIGTPPRAGSAAAGAAKATADARAARSSCRGRRYGSQGALAGAPGQAGRRKRARSAGTVVLQEPARRGAPAGAAARGARTDAPKIVAEARGCKRLRGSTGRAWAEAHAASKIGGLRPVAAARASPCPTRFPSIMAPPSILR